MNVKIALKSLLDNFPREVGMQFLTTQKLQSKIPFDEFSLLSQCKFFLSIQHSKQLDIGWGAAPRNPFDAEIAMGNDIRESLVGNIVAADLQYVGISFENCLLLHMILLSIFLGFSIESALVFPLSN